MRILGIETSCDETAAAVVENRGMRGGAGGAAWENLTIRSNVVHSQRAVHAEYGGVVPELASRAHIRHIMPVITTALDEGGTTPRGLDGIAVTAGPGLAGGLLVGLSVAKGLAISLDRPLIGVHHMEGHLLTPLFPEQGGSKVDFPFTALLVSGGHTVLLHARAFGNYQLLGQTRDDAVGEAFDKGARMLGLGYPGGPALAALARGGNARAVRFPRVLLDRNRFDFSFSGLKTALRTQLLREPVSPDDTQTRSNLAASYQEALVETLAIKALAACKHVASTTLLVAGGVGANQRLRELLSQRAGAAIRVVFPSPGLCTDNGAMIALAGLQRLAGGWRSDLELDAKPRWPIAHICT